MREEFPWRRDRPVAFIRTSHFPSLDGFEEIKAAFNEIDFHIVEDCDARDIRLSTTVEAIRYIALSVPLLAFVTAITSRAGEDAYLSLKRLCQKIRAAYKSPEQVIELKGEEGVFHVSFTVNLPDASFQQFFSIADNYLTQGITRGSLSRSQPPKLQWSDRWKRWIAYTEIEYLPSDHQYISAYRVIARRVPPMSSRIATDHLDLPPRLKNTCAQEELSSFLGKSAEGSVIPWQRAAIVCAYHSIWAPSVSELAHNFVVSDSFIVAVLRDFYEYKFAAFDALFENGVEEIVPSELYSEIVHIARSNPSVYGIVDEPWTVSSLSNFLVQEGVIEDISHWRLGKVLAKSGISIINT